MRSAWLLDDAVDRPQAADEAARLIPAAAGPLTPFKFVKALAARGLPDAALSLVRARAAPRRPAPTLGTLCVSLAPSDVGGSERPC